MSPLDEFEATLLREIEKYDEARQPIMAKLWARLTDARLARDWDATDSYQQQIAERIRERELALEPIRRELVRIANLRPPRPIVIPADADVDGILSHVRQNFVARDSDAAP